MASRDMIASSSPEAFSCAGREKSAQIGLLNIWRAFLNNQILLENLQSTTNIKFNETTMKKRPTWE